MSKQNINIQDGYLFQQLKDGKPVRLTMLSGQVLEGVLKRFDRFALIVEHNSREKLVYKHGIATVESSAF